MTDGNVEKIERVLEIKFSGGVKKTVRENEIVDINFYCEDVRFLSHPTNARGVTGRVSCIKDDVIHVDCGTLFNSKEEIIRIKDIYYIGIADPEHIEDKRRM